MALDFPNTPTLNQVYTAPNGAMWMWDGVKWTAIASVSQYAANNNVGRNLIHNPLFNVAQRGVGPFTATVYTFDRWLLVVSNDTVSFSRTANSTPIAGDEAATWVAGMSFTGSAVASAVTRLAQPIEDVRRLSGKTITVSFYAIGSTAQKLGVNLDQYFGTGGSPSATVSLAGQAVQLTTAWARYSLTFTLPSVTAKTIGANNDHATFLNFWYSSGATNNVNAGGIGVQSGNILTWGVQLEVGSVATPLEKPDPRYDLANCQRFYQAVTCAVRAATPGVASMLSPVYYPTMRATPTSALLTAGSRSNISSPSFTPQTVNHGFFGCASTGAVDAYIIGESYYLSADL